MKNETIEIFEKHCKTRFPREFGKKFERGFHRNDVVQNAEEIFNLCKFFDFIDCYCSVYSFKEYNSETWIRESAVIDTLVFDLDHKTDLKIPFKEAKKLVEYLIEKNTTPRVYFSGMKGFHVYVDFPPVELENPKEVIKRIGASIAEKLGLTSIDYQVFELARLIRLPLTIHSKTGYKCTPINPEKFLKMDLNSVIHFCKFSHSPIEIHESWDFAKLMKYEDFKLSVETAVRALSPARKFRPRGNGDWRVRRVEHYIKVLRENGRLSADPEVVRIHARNPNVNPANLGSIEHIARVHLCLLLIELGYSDSEIHDVFKLAEDYNPDKVSYYIKYNREWLRRKKEAEACG